MNRDLRCGFLVEIIGGALGMGLCRDNGAVVVLENFQPCRDIGGIAFSRFRVLFEADAQERGARHGSKFLAAVTFIAQLLRPTSRGAADALSRASIHGRGRRNSFRRRGKLRTPGSARSPIPAHSIRDFRRAPCLAS